MGKGGIEMVVNTEYNQPWIFQRADPYVIKTDGKYYFTASVPEYDRIVLRCSETLEGLAKAEEKIIWKCHKSGPMSKNIWAPELHKVFGKWVIYFAGGEQEDMWHIRPYVLVCTGDDPLNDAWEEAGRMQPADNDPFSFRAFSLDMTVFDHNGKTYAVWAEKVSVGPQISNLYIAELETYNKLKTVQVLLTTPDYDWERIGFWVCEGPAVLMHEGKLFLTYSASATGACYCMGMLTASLDSDLLDPLSWKKERYPVLATVEEKGIFGPGHNSFTLSDDDKDDICVVHFRQEKEIEGDPLYNPNRHATFIKVQWDSNGRPVLSF